MTQAQPIRAGSPGPLRAILAAFQAGAGTVGALEQATGLPADVVRTGLDHLVRMGRLDAREMANGCPSGGCGSCASASADGGAGCGAAGPTSARRGPVLVALSLRRPA